MSANLCSVAASIPSGTPGVAGVINTLPSQGCSTFVPKADTESVNLSSTTVIDQVINELTQQNVIDAFNSVTSMVSQNVKFKADVVSGSDVTISLGTNLVSHMALSQFINTTQFSQLSTQSQYLLKGIQESTGPYVENTNVRNMLKIIQQHISLENIQKARQMVVTNIQQNVDAQVGQITNGSTVTISVDTNQYNDMMASIIIQAAQTNNLDSNIISQLEDAQKASNTSGYMTIVYIVLIIAAILIAIGIIAYFAYNSETTQKIAPMLMTAAAPEVMIPAQAASKVAGR